MDDESMQALLAISNKSDLWTWDDKMEWKNSVRIIWKGGRIICNNKKVVWCIGTFDIAACIFC